MTKPCLGADPHPRVPNLQAPPGACDCHAHVFGPASRYPWFPDRHYMPPDAPLSEFERMLRTIGMERAVLVQPSVYGTDNTAMLDAMGEATLAMRGVAVVGEDVSDDELERLHAAGVRGLRFNLRFRGGLPIEAMAAIAARIQPLGWHIQIFTDVTKLPDVEATLAPLPVDVVIDHMGLMHPDEGLDNPGWQGMLSLLRGGRCWVKLSGAYRCTREGAPYDDVASIARTLIETAPDKMVWATDWPHPSLQAGMPNDGDLCDLLATWAPEPELQRKILVDNPAALYDF